MYPAAGWQYEKVKSESEVLNFKLYRKDPLPEVEAEIELSKVVGTDHDSYNSGNWLQMQFNLLHHARYTVEEYVDMARNPDAYATGPEPVVVRQYGEEYILCQSGNHRACHAKFAGLSHIRARVQRCIMNQTLAELQPTNRLNSAQDAAEAGGWFSKLLRFIRLNS